jgi:hypothetical protein
MVTLQPKRRDRIAPLYVVRVLDDLCLQQLDLYTVEIVKCYSKKKNVRNVKNQKTRLSVTEHGLWLWSLIIDLHDAVMVCR